MTALTCSAASLDVDEPLEGTATENVKTWVLLEYTRPWAPKPLEPSELTTPVKDYLKAWLEDESVRHQFIRKPGATVKRPTLFIGHAFGDDPWVLRFGLDRYEDLLSLDLGEILASRAHPTATRLEAPLHLVCAHARRDRCCGVHGGSLYREMARLEGVEVWQTSHLGGHRFAACVVSLPEGICYGRLRAEHAKPLAEAHARRELLDLDHLRGRCAFAGPTQAAETFLRRRLNERSLCEGRFVAAEQRQPHRWTVRFAFDGVSYEVDVERQELEAQRPPSCDAAPETGTRFVERT